MSSSAKNDLSSLQIPASIRSLAEAVAKAGGQAWLVGGGVRDHLMGLAVKDYDVEVHRLPIDHLEKVLRRLGTVNAVGKSFGVFKLRPRGSSPDDEEIDVSIPRRDSNAGPGHTGIKVEGDPFMPLEEAVARRDLTINALMVDVLTGVLVDPSGGLVDLEAGTLRAVDPTSFLDDPLRALRVAQFISRTGFVPDAELTDLCRRAPLEELPEERIQTEWAKLLLRGTALPAALAFARSTTLLSRVFPEHIGSPELDRALHRALPAREGLEGRGRRWTLMLAVWLAETPAEGIVATLDRLRLHKAGGYDVRRQLLSLLPHRRDPIDSDAALRHLSVHGELEILLHARQAISGDAAAAIARAQELEIAWSKPAALLQGRDLKQLGFPPGRAMGHTLQAAYTAQLDGTLTTKEAALAWAASRRS